MMKALTAVPVSDKNRRGGMTLVEVILGIAILAILAVMGATALFYPRYLVVTSALEQSAIHAGSAEIERYLNNYLNPVTNGVFKTSGWPLINVSRSITTNKEFVNISDSYRYLVISTAITYRDGKTVDLVTYRSLEVSSSER
jgi:prepilin-type N-terminal cleavage/methylation domain-containing protein